MFETEEQEQIRIRLADSLRWVVSQRLVPKVGGARYALLEIMGANLRTQETMRLGESEGKTFYEIIEAAICSAGARSITPASKPTNRVSSRRKPPCLSHQTQRRFARPYTTPKRAAARSPPPPARCG